MKFFKQKDDISIGICIPCRDTLHSKFAMSLARLFAKSALATYEAELYMLQGSLISDQRQRLARLAIDQNHTHILWLDSDMVFPDTIIDSMLNHNLDIVACNYSTRTEPYKSVAYKKIGDWDSWITNNELDTIVEVEGVGMGCMLTKTSVFENMQLPWFEISYRPEYQTHLGEDFYFCTKARALGYKIMIDTQSSKNIQHIGSFDFKLNHK